MAEFENTTTATNKKMDLSVKTRGSPASSATAFFHRSFTIQSARATPKPYVQSPSRFTNSFDSMKGKVRKIRNLFEASRSHPKSISDDSSHKSLMPTTSSSSSSSSSSQLPPPGKLLSIKSMAPDHNRYLSIFNSSWVVKLADTEDRIVVYFTSLRGVRRTFEDCYAVRMIFRGFRVWVDERDISMDSAYKKELQSVLGEKSVTLPQVFIRGRHAGGAEVIKQMFETGELAKVLDGFPRREPGFVCQGCGDVRFVPCGFCSGSRKIFDEDEGFSKRCLECNENGLMRCQDCCS
ncbi:Uncharacterized protein At5g39865 [Linum grandiflorum]